MAVCHRRTSHHAGNTFDLSGNDQIDQRFPGITQEFLQGQFRYTSQRIFISVLRHQAQLHLPAALFVCLDQFINDLFPVFHSGLKVEGNQLCIFLLCHVINTDLLDLQRIADRLNSRKLSQLNSDSTPSMAPLAGVASAGIRISVMSRS